MLLLLLLFLPLTATMELTANDSKVVGNLTNRFYYHYANMTLTANQTNFTTLVDALFHEDIVIDIPRQGTNFYGRREFIGALADTVFGTISSLKLETYGSDPELNDTIAFYGKGKLVYELNKNYTQVPMFPRAVNRKIHLIFRVRVYNATITHLYLFPDGDALVQHIKDDLIARYIPGKYDDFVEEYYDKNGTITFEIPRYGIQILDHEELKEFIRQNALGRIAEITTGELIPLADNYTYEVNTTIRFSGITNPQDNSTNSTLWPPAVNNEVILRAMWKIVNGSFTNMVIYANATDLVNQLHDRFTSLYQQRQHSQLANELFHENGTLEIPSLFRNGTTWIRKILGRKNIANFLQENPVSAILGIKIKELVPDPDNTTLDVEAFMDYRIAVCPNRYHPLLPAGVNAVCQKPPNPPSMPGWSSMDAVLGSVAASIPKHEDLIKHFNGNFKTPSVQDFLNIAVKDKNLTAIFGRGIPYPLWYRLPKIQVKEVAEVEKEPRSISYRLISKIVNGLFVNMALQSTPHDIVQQLYDRVRDLYNVGGKEYDRLAKEIYHERATIHIPLHGYIVSGRDKISLETQNQENPAGTKIIGTTIDKIFPANPDNKSYTVEATMLLSKEESTHTRKVYHSLLETISYEEEDLLLENPGPVTIFITPERPKLHVWKTYNLTQDQLMVL